MTATEVDVVIVGSGPVGSAFARVLSELGAARVLVVDRGPVLSARPGANLKNYLAGGVRQASDDTDVATVPAESLARTGTELWTSRRRPTPESPGPAAEFPGAATSTNVGGMGAHWSCATPEPSLEERGDVLPPDAWPELLAESARLLAASNSAFAGSRRGKAMITLLDRAFGERLERRAQVMPHACRRTSDGRLDWTGADTVLGPLLDAPDDSFELRPATLCRRVLLDESGARAVGVELVDIATGERSTVRSRYVVVAADSLRTPQLLWASGVRPAALGRHLNEHPMVAATVLLSDEAMAGVPDASAEDCGDQRAAVWVPYAAPDHRFSGQLENSAGSPAGFEIEALRGVPRSRIVSLTWFCPKEPLADNWLEFLDSPDDAGLPAVEIHYRLSERDQAAVSRGIELTNLAGTAIGEFVPGEEPALLSDGLSLHYMGTTRMGRADDGTSVCDSNSQVWGVEGLYVGGNGVIPVATAGNPTLTSVALAVRAARSIAADLAASASASSSASAPSRSPSPSKLADQLDEVGFAVLRGLLSATELEQIRAEAVALCRGERGVPAGLPAVRADAPDDAVLAGVLALDNPHKVSPVLAELLGHDRLVEVLTTAIGPDVKAMQSILFIKSAGRPGQAWHQDELFIPTRDRSLTAAWIALDDATVDNGCLWVIPGSHRRGVLYPDREQDDPRFDCSDEAFGFPYTDDDAVPVEVRAGDVVFFNGYLLHRSLPNRAQAMRRAYVCHYMSAQSLLPWRALPAGVHVGEHDYRDIVMVAGRDPYAAKGIADQSPFEVRAEGTGGCAR